MPRHSLVVRVTHWINAIASFALIVSGVAILLAHPRLYWGETGAVGAPSLIDLPIPFIFGHSGWGRYLHFLAAWVGTISGVVYVSAGIVTRRFGHELLPSKAEWSWTHVQRVIVDHARLRLSEHASFQSYNVLQRLTYVAVIFVLGPLVLMSGLAFSPMLASAAPWLVGVFGGQHRPGNDYRLQAFILGNSPSQSCRALSPSSRKPSPEDDSRLFRVAARDAVFEGGHAVAVVLCTVLLRVRIRSNTTTAAMANVAPNQNGTGGP